MTLLDVYDTPETNGIFNGFINLEVPWQGERMAQNLNILYYYMHSGQKTISPFVTSRLDDNDKIDDTANSRMAELIYNVCSESWKRDYLALVTTEYSPIENTERHTTENVTTTGSKSGTSTLADTGTDTHAHTGTDTTARTGTDTRAKSGDDTATHGGTDTNTVDGTTTDKLTGTDTHDITATDGTTHTGTDTVAETGTDTTAHTGTDTVAETGTDTLAHTGDDTHTVTSDTIARTHEYRLTRELPTGTTTTDNSIYGYNSETAANDSKSVVTLDQDTKTITRTMSIKTDSEGNPVLDDDGNEIKEPEKNQVQTTVESTDVMGHGETVTDTKALDTTTTHGETVTDTKALETTTTHDTKDDTTTTSTDTLTHDTTGIVTNAETGTRTLDLTDKTTYNSKDTQTLDLSDKTEYNNTSTETLAINHNGTTSEDTSDNQQRELYTHGNIGITTNQAMITEEIELRKTKFYNLVFDDIDRFLTLAVY